MLNLVIYVYPHPHPHPLPLPASRDRRHLDILYKAHDNKTANSNGN